MGTCNLTVLGASEHNTYCVVCRGCCLLPVELCPEEHYWFQFPQSLHKLGISQFLTLGNGSDAVLVRDRQPFKKKVWDKQPFKKKKYETSNVIVAPWPCTFVRVIFHFHCCLEQKCGRDYVMCPHTYVSHGIRWIFVTQITNIWGVFGYLPLLRLQGPNWPFCQTWVTNLILNPSTPFFPNHWSSRFVLSQTSLNMLSLN